MSRVVRAAFAYFVSVFALGFGLGTIRVLILAPAVGEWWATIIELPIMLGASWLFCGWSLRHFSVPRQFPHRAVMGGLAFALLMGAEVGLGLRLFDRGMEAQLQAMTQGPGSVGLLSQLLFAAFPVFHLGTGASR